MKARDVTMDADSNQTSDSSAADGAETATSATAEQEAPVAQTTAADVQDHTNGHRNAGAGGRSRHSASRGGGGNGNASDIGTLRSLTPEARRPNFRPLGAFATAGNCLGPAAAAVAAAAAGAGDSSLSMEKDDSSAPKVSEELTYRTQGFHRKGVFRWIIDNYSHLPQQPKRRTFTRKFSLCGHMWQLSVTPGGEESDATESFLSVYLWYQGEEEIETMATIQLVDLNERDRYKIQHHMSRVMAPYDDDRNGISKARGWAKFAPTNYITHFAKDDRIVLELQLQVKGEALHSVQKTATFREFGRPDADRASQLLRKDFERLLQTGTFVDVTFDVSGTEFKAHKAIIAIRSPVLAAMFSHNTVENASNRVEIADVQPGIFAELLKYIYSSQCSLEHAELLLGAADRFCLVELCELCALRLLGTLSIENVCDRLILGHDHSVARLKSGCLTFISANAEAVLNSEGYRSLRQARPQLPAEILETIYCDKEAAKKCKGTHDSQDVSDAGGNGRPEMKRSRREAPQSDTGEADAAVRTMAHPPAMRTTDNDATQQPELRQEAVSQTTAAPVRGEENSEWASWE